MAEKPEATKATAIKYSASNAQPATHPKNSPNKTLIQEYAEPAKAWLQPFQHMKMQLNQQQLQLIDKATAGPACSAATTPGSVKIDVDTIVPTPNARKSLTRNVRFKCPSLL